MYAGLGDYPPPSPSVAGEHCSPDGNGFVCESGLQCCPDPSTGGGLCANVCLDETVIPVGPGSGAAKPAGISTPSVEIAGERVNMGFLVIAAIVVGAGAFYYGSKR